MENNIASYIRILVNRYKLYLFSLLIIALIAAMLNLLVDYQVKNIIDNILKDPRQKLTQNIIAFAFYIFASHGMFFITRILDLSYKPRILKEILENAYIRVSAHSLYWFDSHLSGSISSKISDLQDNIITLISALFSSFVRLILILISIIFLLYINYITSLILVGFIILYVPILYIMLKKQMQLQEEYTQSRQEAIGIINDSILNTTTVKIIGNIWNELKLKIIPAIDNWSYKDKKVRKFNTYYVDLADTILASLMGGAQMWVLANLYKNGQITIGSFAFICTVTLNVHNELNDLLQDILFNINPKIAIIKSSYDFIYSHTNKDIITSNNAKILSRIKGEIIYRNVTFSYGRETNVIEDLNIHIKSGEKIGIVGSSGAGKTSFIKCLYRYFDLKSGNIFIDGTDISEVTEESLREQISLIPQDITMFHRTIKENLLIAKSDATMDEIKAACKIAEIHDMIEQMPMKYDSIVGERGIKLSGGQRQRIAIARAILKDAPILILDEATSALDTPTEILIQQSINNMLNFLKSTILVIAHRLSTLLNMDQILVFDKGKIIQAGTHNQLLLEDNIYRKLYDAQNQVFLGEDIDK